MEHLALQAGQQYDKLQEHCFIHLSTEYRFLAPGIHKLSFL